LQHKAIGVSHAGLMIPYDGTLLGLGIGNATINKQKVGMPVIIWRE